jgi:hypothetical protein
LIEKYLLSRYPDNHPNTIAVREFVAHICRKHMDLGLADPNFESNLCCADDSRHWQRLSEALFTNELLEACLNIRSSKDGPDILIQHGDRNVWIEVICPKAERVPEEWLQPRFGDKGNVEVRSLPHEAILLRWTAAIKEKAEKLLGRPAEKGVASKVGYLGKGVVSPADPYVIAVNGRLRKLPRQVDSSEVEFFPASNRSRNTAGGRLPSASWGRSSL